MLEKGGWEIRKSQYSQDGAKRKHAIEPQRRGVPSLAMPTFRQSKRRSSATTRKSKRKKKMLKKSRPGEKESHTTAARAEKEVSGA